MNENVTASGGIKIPKDSQTVFNGGVRTLSEEITEGFNALGQLDLAKSIIKQLDLEIERLKATIAQMTIDSGKEVKPAKYTDAWWKEVEEFNKQLKELNK